MTLQSNRLKPPRLLICYSNYDGPAHVKAVMQLGAFIQQHMATQVVEVTFHCSNLTLVLSLNSVYNPKQGFI